MVQEYLFWLPWIDWVNFNPDDGNGQFSERFLLFILFMYNTKSVIVNARELQNPVKCHHQ